MNHGHVKKHLADYLEGDLGLADRALVDAHLDQCEPCASEVKEMQQTIQLLRRMPEPETPPMIAANVMRRIRLEESQPGPLRRVLGAVATIFEPSFVLPASAIAAAALVVVVLQEPNAGGLGGLWGNTLGSDTSVLQADGMRPGRDAGLEARGSMTAATLMGGLPSTESGGRDMRRVAPVSGAQVQMDRGESGEQRRAAEALAMRGRVELDVPTPRRMVFADPVLVPPIPQALVGDVYASSRMASSHAGGGLLAPPPFVQDRFVASGLSDAMAGARTVSQSFVPRAAGVSSSGGEDPRDAWLARGLEQPVDFARFLGDKTLAEQELWISRLTQRAESRGLLEELVRALQTSGDDTAAWLAKDFSAEAERARSQTGSAGETPRR